MLRKHSLLSLKVRCYLYRGINRFPLNSLYFPVVFTHSPLHFYYFPVVHVLEGRVHYIKLWDHLWKREKLDLRSTKCFVCFQKMLLRNSGRSSGPDEAEHGREKKEVEEGGLHQRTKPGQCYCKFTPHIVNIWIPDTQYPDPSEYQTFLSSTLGKSVWNKTVVYVCFFLTWTPYKTVQSWRHDACSETAGTREG